MIPLISDEIQGYADRYTSGESALLTELRELTFAERADKSMLSGFYQGRFLAMLSKMLRPRRILEIGTYMGYSALCLAEGLAEDGKIITLDIQPETYATANDFFARSEHKDMIDSRLANAIEVIPTLDETFDLVFIDADKPNYINYFNLVFSKLRVGGIIAADNVLWSGNVLKAEKDKDDDESTVALYEFSKAINADERVSNILLTVRDGLMLIRKDKD